MKWLELLPEYVKAFALIVGAAWAYWKFIYQRQREPATDIDVDLKFVGVQKEKWIIEVTCFLENKSLVRHTYRDFQVKIRYLEHTDEITDGSKEIYYQLQAEKKIDARIEKAKRFFAGVDDSKTNQNYINPRQQFRHRYITWIPRSATFVWVKCEFDFGVGRRGKPQKMNTQRIFRVPDAL
ncbi:MAG: hypothetical protein ACREA9_20470 [Pyrinomonadaceae bacterium]